MSEKLKVRGTRVSFQMKSLSVVENALRNISAYGYGEMRHHFRKL